MNQSLIKLRSQLAHLHANFTNSPDGVVADRDIGRREVLGEDAHESADLGLDVCETDLGEIAKESKCALPNVQLRVLGALME